MSLHPTVSVVMPVRNEERFVAAAIRSVLDQTYADAEVLVVDGRSQDRTRSVVAAIAEQDPRVRLLDNPDGSIPAALNVGLHASSGRYLARVDAHARISDDYVERAVRQLEADPGVAAIGGCRHGVAETRTGRTVAAVLSSPFGVGNSINHYGTQGQDTDHASFGVYRLHVLREINGWDEQLTVNEDVDLDHRLLSRGHRIRYDPGMHIYWQVRETVRDLGRQYRRYGRGKAAMVRKNGTSAVRPRHLAAPALVVGLGAAGGLVAAGRPRSAVALTMPYMAALVAASAVTARRCVEQGDDVRGVALPFAFAAMHLGWGVGFLEGLLLRSSPSASSAPPPRVNRRGSARRPERS